MFIPRMICAILLGGLLFVSANSQFIPLPEHPRPDFERTQWLNLNGPWNFRFDPENIGVSEAWFEKPVFDQKILVPFPWGSKLSGVKNEAHIAWYGREIAVPEEWSGKEIILVIGACDWYTSVWIDGQKAGDHQGGYTPFEFNLSPYLTKGKKKCQLIIRVDDTPHNFKLEGKQGYGEAKGIWQTVYLEARSKPYFTSLKFIPNIDQSLVKFSAKLSEPAKKGTYISAKIQLPGNTDTLVRIAVKNSQQLVECPIPITRLRLWNPDDPFLYETQLSIHQENRETDRVNSYFGMRKIGVMNLPGTQIPYIALNNQPVYLQLTLDQCYHPEGFYTYPSDEFMRDEILRSKKIGLNGNRLHIKVEIPRKLYWADKLGLLIMADVPNSWGEPEPAQRKEWEFAMRGMLERDFNHPCIFSWVLFNETWGLFSTDATGKRVFADSTARWVSDMYHITKILDPSRLVEDNSPCNYDHIISDINSWHAYLPGYDWENFLKTVSDSTFSGSPWNYLHPYVQGNVPMINSECGNVWGYEGSTGDVDYSWDYHRMMNVFRMHPKMAGWLYTEHHDVINEWNGYYRYDRSEKETGLGELVRGMSLKDFHSPYYLSAGGDLCQSVLPGEHMEFPLYASFMSGAQENDSLYILTEIYGWDNTGSDFYLQGSRKLVPCTAWFHGEIMQCSLDFPNQPSLILFAYSLETKSGNVLHRNFTSFHVEQGPSARDEVKESGNNHQRIVRFAPGSYTQAQWSTCTRKVFEGKKVWGDGAGYFEFRIPWPEGLKRDEITSVSLVLEVSAKQLFGKDKTENKVEDGDYMRGAGLHDPSKNPNAYPMTDSHKTPSLLQIYCNGKSAGQYYLEDDPADHRGILSWYSQPENRRLDEAGSYGYLVKAMIPKESLKEGKDIVVKLEVPDSFPGGLAIYGEQFGRYPVDPSLIFDLK